MCEVLSHVGIKNINTADKATKETTDMPGMVSIRLPNTPVGLETSIGKGSAKSVLENWIH